MLSDSAVQYAFMICSKKEQYRVGIYCGDKECREQVLAWIDMIYKAYSPCIVENMIHQRNMSCVLFKNGSSISVLHAGDSARGHRFYLSIYDPSIPFDAMKIVRISELGDKQYQEMNTKSKTTHQFLEEKEEQK